MSFETYEHCKSITKSSGIYYKGITMYVTLDYNTPYVYDDEERGGSLDFALTVRDSADDIPLT